MIDSKRTTICERCRSSVPVASLKYVPTGIDSEVALCPDCVEKTRQHTSERRDRTRPAGKAQFLCKRCNFKFSKPETVDEAGIACPFCGKKDRIESYGVNYAEALVRDPSY